MLYFSDFEVGEKVRLNESCFIKDDGEHTVEADQSPEMRVVRNNSGAACRHPGHWDKVKGQKIRRFIDGNGRSIQVGDKIRHNGSSQDWEACDRGFAENGGTSVGVPSPNTNLPFLVVRDIFTDKSGNTWFQKDGGFPGNPCVRADYWLKYEDKNKTGKDYVMEAPEGEGWGLFRYFGPGDCLDAVNVSSDYDYRIQQSESHVAYWYRPRKREGYVGEVYGVPVWVDKELNEEGEEKMELKNIKPENLKEAKDKFDKGRANAEVGYALNTLTNAQNNIDTIDRDIKSLMEKRKPYEEIVATFNKKK